MEVPTDDGELSQFLVASNTGCGFIVSTLD